MRKSLPALMFVNAEESRLSMLRNWVLENVVTEISMTERQFWNLASLQPVAEKPVLLMNMAWRTDMVHYLKRLFA